MARALLSATSATLPTLPSRLDWLGLWCKDQSRDTLQNNDAVLWWSLQVARWHEQWPEDRGGQRAVQNQWQEGRQAEEGETEVVGGKIEGRLARRQRNDREILSHRYAR